MKIRRVVVNQRKAQLEIVAANGTVFPLPFSQLSPRPTSANRIREAHPDKELAKEAVTYVLESGVEGSVHLDAVLEYNQDPHTMSELLLHQLTVQARACIAQSGLSQREVARLSRDTNSCALRGHLLLRTSGLVLPSSGPADGGRSPGGRTAFSSSLAPLPQPDQARAAGSSAR